MVFEDEVLQESQVGGSDSNMCFVSREVVATAQNCAKRFENSQNLLKTSVFTIKAHVNFIQFKLEAAGGILL